MVEIALRGQLLFGDLEPLVDRLRRVGAAAGESLAQDRRVRRGNEDLDRVRFRGANLLGSLDLDLQDDRVAGLEAPLDLAAQGAVAIAAVGGELEEVLLLDPLLELLGGEEVVVAAVERVVAETDSSRSGTARSSSLIRVPLPTPEGPVMTKTLLAMRPEMMTAGAVG